MKQLIFIFFVLAAIVACNDTKVGYLEVEEAGYDPDSMIIRKVLDPVLDAKRIERQFPWVSPQIQGILGTLPFNYHIARVHSGNGDAEAFKKGAKLRGDSAFEIPVVNDIPKGTYYIDITISNEGYSFTRDSLFIIIVK